MAGNFQTYAIQNEKPTYSPLDTILTHFNVFQLFLVVLVNLGWNAKFNLYAISFSSVLFCISLVLSFPQISLYSSHLSITQSSSHHAPPLLHGFISYLVNGNKSWKRERREKLEKHHLVSLSLLRWENFFRGWICCNLVWSNCCIQGKVTAKEKWQQIVIKLTMFGNMWERCGWEDYGSLMDLKKQYGLVTRVSHAWVL